MNMQTGTLSTKSIRDPLSGGREAPGKPRLSAKISAAVDMLATSGKTQREVATALKLNEDALSRALNREGVRDWLDYRKALFCMDADQLRGLAKAIAIKEGLTLLQEAKSEAVRARLVEFFAGEPRGAAVNVQINNAQATGYTYPKPAPVTVDHAQITPTQDVDP